MSAFSGVLFGVLFAWQMPHLAAIAWMHRDDYANAGFAFLLAGDTSGQSTALQALAFSGLLAGITFIPSFMGWAGAGYLLGMFILDGILLACAGLFLLERSSESARRLFVVSIVYLPVFLTLILFARR
jgi:protoheme IX farnesyltransferase